MNNKRMKSDPLKPAILVVAAIALFSYKHFEAGTIRGSVTPPDGALHVMAISQKDTSLGNIASGTFQLNNLKPGNYSVVIEARAPYKGVVRDGVTVGDGGLVDLGEIQLAK